MEMRQTDDRQFLDRLSSAVGSGRACCCEIDFTDCFDNCTFLGCAGESEFQVISGFPGSLMLGATR